MARQSDPTKKPSAEGVRLRRLRLRAKLSQEKLARRVGVTTHTIWRLENDSVFNPRVQTVRAIAEALRVDVVSLLGSGRKKGPD